MLTSILNKTKLISILIMCILAGIIYNQRNTIKQKNQEIDNLANTTLFYQEQLSDINAETRTLKLSIEDLKQSKDSLIHNMDSVRKELKIKEKELKQAQSQNQEIKIDTTIVVNEPDFIKEIKPNNLTSLTIIKKDSLLTAKLDIKNSQYLYVSKKKEYRRNYKNWFQRLIHFDFKKRGVYKYQIHNTNPIIKVTDTRVIEIED